MNRPAVPRAWSCRRPTGRRGPPACPARVATDVPELPLLAAPVVVRNVLESHRGAGRTGSDVRARGRRGLAAEREKPPSGLERLVEGRAVAASGAIASNEARAPRARAAIRTRSSVPEAVAPTATASTPATVSPVTRTVSPSTTPAAAASRRVSVRSSASSRSIRSSAARSAPSATSSGAPRSNSTSSVVSSARARARRGPRGARSATRGMVRTRRPRSAGREHERRARQHGGGERDGDDPVTRATRADRSRAGKRFCVASTSPTTPARSSPCRIHASVRDQRLQLPVERHPHSGEHAKREVVRPQALEVAGHRLGDAARAHRHDRDGELEMAGARRP